jgi:hypothetical protein
MTEVEKVKIAIKNTIKKRWKHTRMAESLLYEIARSAIDALKQEEKNMARCERCNACESQWDFTPCKHCNFPLTDTRISDQKAQDDKDIEEFYKEPDDLELSHVYPINDLEQHKLEGSDCKCNPVVDEYGVVVHNSFDGREVIKN